MTFLPPPLDNLYVFIAVLLGLLVLGFAVMKSRQASARLEAARKEKARIIREAKHAARNKAE